MEKPKKPEGIDLVIHPDLTEEQVETCLEVLGDLFEAAGGKGGLKVEFAEEEE